MVQKRLPEAGVWPRLLTPCCGPTMPCTLMTTRPGVIKTATNWGQRSLNNLLAYDSHPSTQSPVHIHHYRCGIHDDAGCSMVAYWPSSMPPVPGSMRPRTKACLGETSLGRSGHDTNSIRTYPMLYLGCKQ